MLLMCNPVRDHGPAEWHRDMYPPIAAPLQAYSDDIRETGPRYVQWNISLYEDDVLSVVPGSHVQINSEEEKELLSADPRHPLPDAVQTHLQPGDGVVYILPILHWARNYSTKKRRCIHGGFSSLIAYDEALNLSRLPTAAQDTFARWSRRGSGLRDHTEAANRAAIDGDAAAYERALEALHPGRGDAGRLLSSIYLGKAARYILGCKRDDADDWESEKERSYGQDTHPITLHWGSEMADRFTTDEAQRLVDAFRPLDSALRSDVQQYCPGFQGGPSAYYFERMPDFTLKDLFRSWHALPARPNPTR